MIEATHNSMGLPKGWVGTELGQIAEILSGIGFPKKYQGKTEGEFPFYKVGDISQAVMKGSVCLRRANNYVSKDVCRELKGKPLKAGTVVFAKIGEAIKLNRRAILAGEALVDNNVMGVCAFLTDMSSFLYYFLLTVTLGDLSRATTVPSVRKGDVERISFLLPPLPEQKRIVAKIKELVTKLDAGVEALRKVKAELKRYRQAVLKHAFEGKLTAEWREKNKDKLESASKLLERIAKEREKNATKTKGRKKKLPHLDTSNLLELPDGWEWIQVFDIARDQQYGTSAKATKDSCGIPVLRMGNIQDGELAFDNLKYMPKDWSEHDKFTLNVGDVLFNRTNSPELVGKTAVYKKHHPVTTFASYLIKVEVEMDLYVPEALSYFINSHFGRNYINSVVSQQVGQANVNGTKLAAMPVPLVSMSEQQELVQEIERHFSIADEVEQTVEKGLKQAERLRQSILKRAFEGKLVPQDPQDEPAEKLLERIRVEKA